MRYKFYDAVHSILDKENPGPPERYEFWSFMSRKRLRSDCSAGQGVGGGFAPRGRRVA